MPHPSEHEAIEDPMITFDEQSALLEQARTKPLERDSMAFEVHDHACTCIDEGTPGGYRDAGLGILDPEGFDAVVARMRKSGVTSVESHAHCGAVTKAAREKLGPDATEAEVDAFGQDWAERVASALGVPHVHRTELKRPAETHDAHVIYVDMVGGARPDHVPEKLPKGFVVTATEAAPEYVAQQARVAVDIALGEHGAYNAQYSVDKPLHVVLLAPEEMTPERHVLVVRLHMALQDLGPRVYIDELEVK